MSCEKKDDSIIDPVFNSPIIINPFISKDTNFTISTAPIINFSASVQVDLNNGDPIKFVICKVYFPTGQLLDSAFMADNGVLPDSTANDGRYSCSFNITGIALSCLQVGIYNIQFYAQNNSGLFSNIIYKNLVVVNTINQPPVLSNPNLPDSVVRPVSGSFDLTLTITVIDPDGECDINSVFFDAYRPTGGYIGRIPMSYTNNNIYSFTAPVLPSAADSSYGYFKYVFQAYDNSNAYSNIVTDSIKFVRP